ncbi:fibrinogen-like protein 1 [Hippocampus comes]|uniref:fibrinogen-like protein 1 n=1 Tax=Hippocampus comes TaxID=109280 RepID=UPI00094E9310|nr:PREDICTED: fibrinogen-like protein 1 [Hippocampus comes]
MGNDVLHHLTSQGKYDLRMAVEDFDEKESFAEYKNFKVDSEKDLYRLHLGEYNGNAGDALADLHTIKQPGAGSSLAGVKFSTYDKQPDGDGKCIRHSKSGWWFSRCDSGNLNGHYDKGPYQAMTNDGIVWYTWHRWLYSIKSVVMMVQAADLEHPQAMVPGQLEPKKAAGPDHPFGQ